VSAFAGSDLRQGLFGLFAAALSALVILGGFVLSMAEGGTPLAQASEPPPLTAPVEQVFPTPGESGPTPTFFAPETQAQGLETEPPVVGAGSPTPAAPTAAPSATAPAHVNCPQPPGWETITIQPGDTLNSLANKHDLDPRELAAMNCLVADTLLPGTLLYVPPGRQAAPPEEKCGPPPGWVFYTVRRGDTLYRLSRLLGVSIRELQQANCMGSSTTLRAGQQMYVPFQPPPPASPAPTRTQPRPAPTSTQAPPTSEPPTQAPPTQRPPTQEPPTQAPPTQEPPTQEPPTQEPPTQEPPTQAPPPVTEPPVTPPVEPPVTEPPATEPPRPTLEP